MMLLMAIEARAEKVREVVGTPAMIEQENRHENETGKKALSEKKQQQQQNLRKRVAERTEVAQWESRMEGL